MEFTSENLEELKLFTVQMLKIYGEAARQQIAEAEAAVARGIELREHAVELLARCTTLATEYAKAKDEFDASDWTIPKIDMGDEPDW